MNTLRVIFRVDKSGPHKGEVTAVFPDHEWSPWAKMSCYAHIGQHSGCSLGWYRKTRPAKHEEYAPLLRELRSIYETGPDAVALVVSKRR